MNVKPTISFPTLGMARLTSGPLTTGSVLFAGSSGGISQDNANFFWDDTNNRLGIGTNAPSGAVTIDGNSDIVQLLVQGHSTQTSSLAVFENSSGTDQITFSNTGAAVFNEAGNDADFRIESDTNPNMMFVDASTDRIGYGTNAPTATVQFDGSSASLSSSYDVVVFNDLTPIASRAETGGKARFMGVVATDGSITSAGQFGTKKVNQVSNDGGFDMFFSPRRNGSPSFEERMRLTSTGKLGIGISNPDNRLLVAEETMGNNVFGMYSNATTSWCRFQYKQGAVNTTDATATTLITYIVPSGVSYLRAHVFGHRTGGTAGSADDSAVYVMTCAVKLLGGSPTFIGAATMDFQAEDQAGWNCQFVASGASILVRVTGAANNNITWHGTLNFAYVNN